MTSNGGSDSTSDEALVLVAKEPVPGQVKTRLCPPLTAEVAAGLYRSFLEDLVAHWAKPRPFRRILAYTPLQARAFFEQLAPDSMGCIPQEGPGLAERLNGLFVRLLSQGISRVVITNTDSPHLPDALVEDGFARLKAGADAVISPDGGGGYSLVGLKEPHPELFLGIVMSTSTVIDETLAEARARRLRVEVLPVCRDIDDAADLEWFVQEMRTAAEPVRARVRRSLEFIQAHLADRGLS